MKMGTDRPLGHWRAHGGTSWLELIPCSEATAASGMNSMSPKLMPPYISSAIMGSLRASAVERICKQEAERCTVHHCSFRPENEIRESKRLPVDGLGWRLSRQQTWKANTTRCCTTHTYLSDVVPRKHISTRIPWVAH